MKLTVDREADALYLDLDAALAAGTLVDITVTGRNAKGESQSTDAVTAAVP